MHDFQLIEDGVLALLSPLSSLGLRTLASYSGELEAGDLAEIVYQFPCMYVIAPELDLVARNRYDAYTAHFTLIVGDRNLRGAAEAARGDASSPGVYALLEAARGKLHGKRVAAGWAPARVVREAAVAYAPAESICVYNAVYRLQAVKA